MISFLDLAGFPWKVSDPDSGASAVRHAMASGPHKQRGIHATARDSLADKKMLASKTKTTYFEVANNSTPFFALVMPTGATPEYCFAE